MEKLEAMKQKLSRKRKLAVGCALGGAVRMLGKILGEEFLKQYNLVKYNHFLQDDLMFVIKDLEQKYVINYGLSIPQDPNTYLENLKANQAVYGANFDYIYQTYENAFNLANQGIMYLGDVPGKAMQIGVGAGILSFLLVAGIPTAQYLICKRKFKKLEKEIGENKEAGMTA